MKLHVAYFAFWTGDSYTLTLEDPQGWKLTIKAEGTNMHLVQRIETIFPDARGVKEEAMADYSAANHYDPDTENPPMSSGKAERTFDISNEVKDQLVALRVS